MVLGGPSNPLLPASELTLMHFVSHLAQTVSFETVKLYLVAVQDLHREFNFPLQINQMHRLQKVLTGIKRLAPTRQLECFPITIQILHSIHTYLQPEHTHNIDHDCYSLGCLHPLAFSVPVNSPVMPLLAPPFTLLPVTSHFSPIVSSLPTCLSASNSPKQTPSCKVTPSP